MIASDIMSSPVYVVGLQENVAHARNLMLSHKISRLPVLDGERLVRIAEIRVLAADPRSKRGELRVNERADECDRAADEPRAQDQRWRVDLARDDARIHEDARADDAAHDDHRRVERPEPSRERQAFRCRPAAVRQRSHQCHDRLNIRCL